MSTSQHTRRAIHYALEGAAVLLLVALATLIAILHVTRPEIPLQHPGRIIGDNGTSAGAAGQRRRNHGR